MNDESVELRPDVSALPYAISARMYFIDRMLRHYGTINRGLIASYFGLSIPQASLDLKQYMELAPGNARYDASAKTYRSTADFAPLWQ